MRFNAVIIFIYPVFFFLTACAQETIQHQVLAYNQANAISSETVLLTNIVNAGLGHEPAMEQHTEYLSQGMVDGSLGSKIANIGGITKVFDLSPALNFNSGMKQLKHQPLDFGNDYAKLTNALPVSTLVRLTETEGFDTALILSLVAAKIEIRRDLDEKLLKIANNICKNDPFDGSCQLYLSIKPSCRNGFRPPIKRRLLSIPTQYLNTPANECAYLGFQALLLRFSLSLHGLQEDPKDEQKIKNIFLRLSGKPLRPGFIKIYMRSPIDIAKYLGHVTRLQNGIDGPRFVAKIGGPRGYEFFKVIRGNGSFNKGVLNARSRDGDHYYIPKEKVITRRSLTTMGIVKRIMGRAISDKIRQADVLVSTE